MTSRPDRIVRKSALTEQIRPLFERPADLVLPRDSHRALSEAARLIEAAERDAAAIREDARQAGIADAVVQASCLLIEAEKQRQAILREAHGEIATLALAAARRLVGDWLDEAPEHMALRVANLLDSVTAARQVVVRVGPMHAEGLETARAALAKRQDGAHVRIEPDSTLGQGDCVLETELGRIDARLDVQFAALLAALSDDRE